MGLGLGGLQQGGGGAASTLAAGATGSDLTLSSTDTALQFISTQASGSDGYKVTTNGARWHVGTGASDYFSSDGTTITTPAPVAALSLTTGNTIASSSTGANFNISSAASDATVSPTIPGTSVIPQNAYTSGDLVFQVRQSDQTALFQVYQGGGVGVGASAAAFWGTAPTVVAGAGASVTAGTAVAFTVGLGGAAQTGTITLPSAATGWVVQMCNVTNTASFVIAQTGGTQTTATFTCYSRTTGLATNWTASDVMRCSAVAY